jgi:biopolymer transport protein ExbD
MRLSKHRRGARLAIDMTPMIDVVFLLLIFFMTVYQISRTNKEAIPLPVAKGSQDQSEGNVTINVDLAGQIIVAGNPLSLIELIDVLQDAIVAADNQADNVMIVLRAHRDGDCRTVNEVIRTLNKLEIKRVRMAVESAP